MAQLKEQLLALLPTGLAQLLAGDSRRELLKKIDATLLVFGAQLLHLDSGAGRPLGADNGEITASELARQAAQLLGKDADDKAAVLLLLPPTEFVATTPNLPGVTRDNLVAVLELQQQSLLPAYEQELALAVNPDSANLGEDHVALWLPEERLSELFAAFAEENLFLAAVKPRLLGLACPDTETRVIDSDDKCVTAAALNRGVIMQWLQVESMDLDQEAFREQWQQELKSHPTGQTLEVADSQDYLERADKNANPAYWFFPGGALAARRQVERGRRLMAATAIVVGLGLVAAIPFLLQSIEFRRAAAILADNRELSAEARADQAVVASFEDEWGPVDDFPDQDLPATLFTLQEALSPDRLTSLEISEGLISIEGTSNDPQAILQRLEQDPLFTEVVFARATNNTRYYIDLRLSPVNFEGYMLRYFPGS